MEVEKAPVKMLAAVKEEKTVIVLSKFGKTTTAVS